MTGSSLPGSRRPAMPTARRSRVRGSRSPRTASAPARSGRDQGARCSARTRMIRELHRDPEAIAIFRADLGQQLERLDTRDRREPLGRREEVTFSSRPFPMDERECNGMPDALPLHPRRLFHDLRDLFSPCEPRYRNRLDVLSSSSVQIQLLKTKPNSCDPDVSVERYLPSAGRSRAARASASATRRTSTTGGRFQNTAADPAQ